MRPYHFYVAFNPLFNDNRVHKTQAHEFYHSLKERVTKKKDPYLYWGKLQVSDYSEPLNLENFRQVVVENNKIQTDTHLYITDYQHLWVGKVSEVCKEIPHHQHTLEFYRGKKVEVWFKIVDFELLTHDAADTLEWLNALYVDNEYFPQKLKGFSPLTEGIRFPMVVQDSTQESFFKTSKPCVLEENKKIQRSGQSMELNDIFKSFVIPPENFRHLPETVKSKIVQAEVLLLEAQAYGRKDRKKLEQATLTYLSCLEILLNETFIAHLRNEIGDKVFVSKEQETPKLVRSGQGIESVLTHLRDFFEPISLQQIKMLLDTPAFFSHTSLDVVFQSKKPFWEYARLELRSTIKNESLLEIKNSLARGDALKVSDRELMLVRNILLGVGGKGIFSDILETYFELRAYRPNVAA